MSNKKQKNTYGWLPKEPILPNVNYNKQNIGTHNHTVLKIGGEILPIAGMLLIAVYSFSSLFYNSLHTDLSMRWLFYCAYFVGIGMAIVGVVLRNGVSTKNSQVLNNRKVLFSALALLTISVFGSVISAEDMTGFAMSHTTQQYSNLVWWANPLMAIISFWIIGFAGWMILLAGRRNNINSQAPPKTAFYVLTVGVLILSANALIQILRFISLTQGVLSSISLVMFYSDLIAIPLGTLCLTIGWIFLLSTNLKFKTKNT